MKVGELSIENYRTLNRLVREEMETVSREVSYHPTEDGQRYYDYLVGLRTKLLTKAKGR